MSSLLEKTKPYQTSWSCLSNPLGGPAARSAVRLEVPGTAGIFCFASQCPCLSSGSALETYYLLSSDIAGSSKFGNIHNEDPDGPKEAPFGSEKASAYAHCTMSVVWLLESSL